MKNLRPEVEVMRATENARPENDGVENDGQILNELQGLENAGLENDGQNISKLLTKLRGVENLLQINLPQGRLKSLPCPQDFPCSICSEVCMVQTINF